ncbi:MAG TPA: alkaline phosphatase D family protein [Myxococcaceae bacterium]|nr:alkaline phosphatase D family protein [Myxococcaceae bacterium]
MDRFDRRTILKSIAVMAAASTFPACGDGGEEDTGSDADGLARFPHGVASGDPKQDTVILWTRVVNVGSVPVDMPLRLEVAVDPEFTQLVVEKDGLTATVAHDSCIKVRVKRLSPGNTYYYRFSLVQGRTRYRSTAGRTRTAPEASADVPIRFAVANCQDYVGRYWNSYQQLLTIAPHELDFFLAIGDYIYETTAADGVPAGSRAIVFGKPSEAIDLGGGNLAARSVGNYRDLYRTYRSDPLLQQVHARWPMIATWDDHEYSDDCWGSTATYFNGRKNEKDDERRRNAEQAFFEYMPIDEGAPGSDPSVDVVTTERPQLYPNQKLWRSFVFGQHLELVMTDYRSYRPDHPVPEDAFPGTVVADQATLVGLLGQAAFDANFPPGLAEYIDVDQPENAGLRSTLVGVATAGAQQEGLSLADAHAWATRVIRGKLAVLVANQMLAAANQRPIPADGLDRGLFYALIGKQSFFSQYGSRYIVVKSSYDLYTALLYARTARASENAFGAEQEKFIVDTLTRSTRTHKVLVSSVSLVSMQLNLTGVPGVPAQFARAFYFDVDQWDGFPNKRAELLGRLSAVQNLIGLSGDIHGTFAGNEKASSPKIALLTAPAISSQTVGEEVGAAVTTFSSDPAFQPGGAVYEALVNGLPQLFQASTGGALKLVDTSSHGFLALAVDGTKARATFTLIPATEITVDYSRQPADALEAKVTTATFDVAGGQLTPVS